MIEMQYTFPTVSKVTVLYKGIYKDYTYFVISYGTHPCCYVALDSTHPYYEVLYDDIPVNCHGGLTFSEHGLIDYKNKHTFIPESYWVIGWDYHHVGDFSGFYYGKNDYLEHLRKWTTEELIEECKNVIDLLDSIANPQRLYK